jgi:ATP-dependent RNA helicase DDX5/DBP2
MVASDVASRGLDIRGLPYVVNYDFPSRLEVYVHRWAGWGGGAGPLTWS